MKRSEVQEKYKWDLDSIIKGSEWEPAFAALSAEKESVAKYRGKLGDKAMLLACLREESDVSIRLENLYVYAKMKQDEDTALAWPLCTCAEATPYTAIFGTWMIKYNKVLSDKLNDATAINEIYSFPSYVRKEMGIE